MCVCVCVCVHVHVHVRVCAYVHVCGYGCERGDIGSHYLEDHKYIKALKKASAMGRIQSLPFSRISPLASSAKMHPTDQMSTTKRNRGQKSNINSC